MTAQTGKVVSVHVGAGDTLEKQAQPQIELALDGVVGDRHRGLSRETWEGDKQPRGTTRRNERQWTAVSVEDLATIGEAMDLAEPLLEDQSVIDQILDHLRASVRQRADLIGRAHNRITHQVAKHSVCNMFSISDRITAEVPLMTPPLS